MAFEPPAGSRAAVAIVGGGFSGTLLALKLAAARPEGRVLLIEPSNRPGRGLAYGACAPSHLLNVPVARMEVGLTPTFADWLAAHGGMDEALAESGGDMAAAFAPRALWGRYLADQLAAARASGAVTVLRGEAVRMLDAPRRGLVLRDGREVEAETVVLATGNLPPRPPLPADHWLQDDPAFVVDPWDRTALEGLDPDAPVLLIGTGLTMVDIALKLTEDGHRGPMVAVSRRGLLPRAHRYGGAWPTFLAPHLPAGPAVLSRIIRAEIRKAVAEGQPWQRVIDAVRPYIGRIWAEWTPADRSRFLRHQRARWDVFRHRMAPRIAAGIETLTAEGRLTVKGGRLRDWRRDGDRLAITLHPRGGGAAETLAAARVINCTGPRSDLKGLEVPLFADLARRGLIAPDALGLGLETADCAVLSARGEASTWLHAVGPLTRPAWWEITAVPEIAAQVDGLAHVLARDVDHAPALATVFLDLGAGI
ncbi:FAD/NAD(P)-binding protein [Caulobacter mirabilis]|nr:FAD/NAD(P)-binding protein [Caulobacter mirabilis]